VNEEYIHTDQENPEIAGLFRDLFEPAFSIWKYAIAQVPKRHRARVAELRGVGQSVVFIPLPGDGRARCAVVDGHDVLELGTSKVEGSYQAVLGEFIDLGVNHMLHSEKIAEHHREGKLPFVVAVMIDERRIRLMAFPDGDERRAIALFELTGAPEPAPVVH